MTALVNRYTKAPVRCVAGFSLLIRVFANPYFNLEGRRLEALSRLFVQNVRIYAYPMTAVDLQEWAKGFSATGLEWSETNGWVSAEQLYVAPPLGHLYSYLLGNNFLFPCQFPEPSPPLLDFHPRKICFFDSDTSPRRRRAMSAWKDQGSLHLDKCDAALKIRNSVEPGWPGGQHRNGCARLRIPRGRFEAQRIV